MIKFLDPRAAVNPKDRPLVPGLDSLEGKIIGIIDNGQSNSTNMFQELSKLIEERLHVKEVIFKTKQEFYLEFKISEDEEEYLLDIYYKPDKRNELLFFTNQVLKPFKDGTVNDGTTQTENQPR